MARDEEEHGAERDQGERLAPVEGASRDGGRETPPALYNGDDPPSQGCGGPNWAAVRERGGGGERIFAFGGLLHPRASQSENLASKGLN